MVMKSLLEHDWGAIGYNLRCCKNAGEANGVWTSMMVGFYVSRVDDDR